MECRSSSFWTYVPPNDKLKEGILVEPTKIPEIVETEVDSAGKKLAIIDLKFGIYSSKTKLMILSLVYCRNKQCEDLQLMWRFFENYQWQVKLR